MTPLTTVRRMAVRGGLGASVSLLLAGLLIPAPAISFCLIFLAVSCAVLPLAFGDTRLRIVAAAALLAGIGLAVFVAGKLQQTPQKQQTTPVLQKG